MVMKHVYQCYTRDVDQVTHYFVKRFLHFPEYAGVPDCLEGYGMHTDFRKACEIAGVKDVAVCEELFSSLTIAPGKAKIISLELYKMNVSRITG